VEQRCIPSDPQREVCNLIDDDCDDEVDENVVEPCINQWDAFEGSTGRCLDGMIVGCDEDRLCLNQNGICEGQMIDCAAKYEVDPCIAAMYDEECDGVDSDCDGLVDDKDYDSDSYIDANCTLAGGDDCDDNNPVINPGVDDDGDGYNVCIDCDDLDSTVNPGALDVCNDGIDQVQNESMIDSLREIVGK
jgi:hypothetical protein